MVKRKRKNKRKSTKVEVNFHVPAFLAIILIPTLIIGVMWIMAGVRCNALGRKIYVLEKQREEYVKQRENEQNRWANLTAPASFQKILKDHGLEMSRPDENNIVRVSNSGDTRVAFNDSKKWAFYE